MREVRKTKKIEEDNGYLRKKKFTPAEKHNAGIGKKNKTDKSQSAGKN